MSGSRDTVAFSSNEAATFWRRLGLSERTAAALARAEIGNIADLNRFSELDLRNRLGSTGVAKLQNMGVFWPSLTIHIAKIVEVVVRRECVAVVQNIIAGKSDALEIIFTTFTTGPEEDSATLSSGRLSLSITIRYLPDGFVIPRVLTPLIVGIVSNVTGVPEPNLYKDLRSSEENAEYFLLIPIPIQPNTYQH